MFNSILKHFYPTATEEFIDLSGKDLRPKNAMAIAKRLKNNKSLHTLNLSDNCLGLKEEGLEIIMRALLHNHNLDSLDLSNNNLGCYKAASCAYAYGMWSCACDECTYNSSISDNTWIIRQFLQKNKSLTSLNLTGNAFNFEEKKLIAEAAKETNLTELSLYEPGRDEVYISKLGNKYPKMRTLYDEGREILLNLSEERAQRLLMLYLVMPVEEEKKDHFEEDIGELAGAKKSLRFSRDKLSKESKVFAKIDSEKHLESKKIR